MLFTRTETSEYYYYQIVDFYLFENCEDEKRAQIYKLCKVI